MNSSRRPPSGDYISATKLAEMGYCETRIVLSEELGPRESARGRDSKERGKAEHTRFDRTVTAFHNRPLEPAAEDRRCFIATAVYGVDDPRTQQLREWRDRVLLKRRFGRFAIRVYYALSPRFARLLEQLPILQAPIRWCLDKIRQGVAG